MKFRRNVIFAWQRIVRAPLQSVLVLLATILGTAVAVFAPAMIEGGRARTIEQRKELGTDRLSIYVEKPTLAAPDLSMENLRMLRARFEDGRVAAIAPVNVVIAAPVRVMAADAGGAPESGTPGHDGQSAVTAPVLGVDESHDEARAFRLGRGAGISAVHVARREAVAVIEPLLARELFGGEDPIGRVVEVRLPTGFGASGAPSRFTVIGVMEQRSEQALQVNDLGMYAKEKDSATTRQLMAQLIQVAGGITGKNDKWKRSDRALHVPISWLPGYPRRIDWGFVRVHDLSDVVVVAEDMKNTLVARGVTAMVSLNAAAPFFVQGKDSRDLLEEYRRLSAALYVICLALGTVVIVCVMLASILERAPEIGIRRVEGATTSDIVQQFLVESGLYSLVGAAIGVCCYPILCEIALIFEPSVAAGYVTPWKHVALTVCVVVLLGILAGIYPALRAARMDPISALRHE